MSELPIQQKLRSMQWEANKRTLPRAHRISEEVLLEAQHLREAGKFDEAAELILRQPSAALAADAVALNGLGHFLFGAGRSEEALDAFTRAERAACRDLAKALVNQANALKVKQAYGKAEVAAVRALDLEPLWFVPYLMLVAVYECRAQASDREASEKILTQMTANCPGWESATELWRYLLTDLDYARLRTDTMFTKLFGRTVEEAKRMLSDG